MNLCNVTDGRFTIFLDAPEDGEADTARAAIRASMNKGEFNEIHPSIVRISYSTADTSNVDVTPTAAPTDLEREATPSNGLPTWAYVLIALGGVLLIGLGVFVWRRRANQGAREVQSVDDEDDIEYHDEEDTGRDDGYQPPGTATTRLSPHEEDYEYDQSSSQGGSRSNASRSNKFT